MTLSPTERLILSNQYRILAHIDPENRNMHEQNAQIVEGGYEREYRRLAEHIFSPLSEEICGEVYEIMSMHESMQDAHNNLGEASPVRESDVIFFGFSGNYEPDQYGYLHFITRGDPKPFEHVRRSQNTSAPGPMLPGYRKMLEVWRTVHKVGRELKADELKSIVEARRA